jgi:P27 family predicted phage terminase small subunit
MARGRKRFPIPAGPEQTPPPPPKELKGEAAKEWKRVTAILCKNRTFSPDDHAALWVYCTSYQQYRDSQSNIDQFGTVLQDGSENRHVGVQKKAFERFSKLLAEFGLTPASRAKFKYENPEPDDGGDFF